MSKATNPPTLKRENKTVFAENEIVSDTEYKDSNETYSGSEDEESTKNLNSKKEKAKKEKSEAEVGESEVGAGGRIKHIKIQDHVQRMQRMSMLSRQIIDIDVAIKALVEQKHNVLSEIRDLLLEEQSVE
jgi:hypothetical protein